MLEKIVHDLFRPENLAHEDERRAIYEMNFPEFSLQGFIVKERLPLGKHAHSRKHEIFKIVEGGGIVFTAKFEGLESSQLSEHKIQRIELGQGGVVHVAPHIAHTFYLNPGSRMICFSSSAFDEKDKDFIPYPDLVEENVLIW